MCKKIIFLLTVLCLATTVWSADVNWDGGGGDGMWNTAANWVGDLVPADPCGAIIDSNSVLGIVNPDVTVTGPAGGSAIKLNMYAWDLGSTATLRVVDSNLNVSGSVALGGSTARGTAYVYADNSNLSVAGTFNYADNDTSAVIDISNCYANIYGLRQQTANNTIGTNPSTSIFNLTDSELEVGYAGQSGGENWVLTGNNLQSNVNIIRSKVVGYPHPSNPNGYIWSTTTSSDNGEIRHQDGGKLIWTIEDSEIYWLGSMNFKQKNLALNRQQFDWNVKNSYFAANNIYLKSFDNGVNIDVNNSQIIAANNFYFGHPAASTGYLGTIGTIKNSTLRGGGGNAGSGLCWKLNTTLGYINFINCNLYWEGINTANFIDDTVTVKKFLSNGVGDPIASSGVIRSVVRKSYTVPGVTAGFVVGGFQTDANSPWAFWPHDAQPDFLDKGTEIGIPLRWEPGVISKNTSQKLYLSTNFDDVNEMNPAALKTDTLAPDANSYTMLPEPPAGEVWYWRVVEVTASGNFEGPVLRFSTIADVGGAKNPVPSTNSTTGVGPAPTVKWTVNGPWVNKEYVYLGTSSAEVTNATPTVPGDGVTLVTINNGTTNQVNFGFLPLVDGSGKPIKYFWRVDESGLVAGTPAYIKGTVWNWTMADYYLFDGFETYTDYTTLHNTWKDGDFDIEFLNGGFITLVTAPKHSGSNAASFNWYSEGYSYAMAWRLVPDAGKDWTSNGIAALTIWFQGNPDNAYPTCYANSGEVSKLYAAIDDGTNPTGAVKQYYDGDANDMFVSSWHEWNVDLSGFAGVDLQNVKLFGIGADLEPAAYGPVIYVDDIRLYGSRCIPALNDLAADLTNDCIVDVDDLLILAGTDWLKEGLGLVAATTPDSSKLVMQYLFEETAGSTAADSSGKGNNGTWYRWVGNDAIPVEVWDISVTEPNTLGWPSYRIKTGKDGSGMRIDMADQEVSIVPPVTVFDTITTDITMSFWFRDFVGSAIGNVDDMMRARSETSPGVYGGQTLRLKFDGSDLDWRDDADDVVAAGAIPWMSAPIDWSLFTFTRDAEYLRIFKNGILIAQGASSGNAILPSRMHFGSSFEVRSGLECMDDGGAGDIDDLRIYNYALSLSDALGLAGIASHDYPVEGVPWNAVSNLNTTGDSLNKIDFKDYSVLGSEWLADALWP